MSFWPQVWRGEWPNKCTTHLDFQCRITGNLIFSHRSDTKILFLLWDVGCLSQKRDSNSQTGAVTSLRVAERPSWLTGSPQSPGVWKWLRLHNTWIHTLSNSHRCLSLTWQRMDGWKCFQFLSYLFQTRVKSHALRRVDLYHQNQSFVFLKSLCFIAVSGDGPPNSTEDEEDD